MVKYVNIFFSRTKNALRLILGIKHRRCKVYQLCSNVDPGMTFDLFTALSNFCLSCCGNVAWHLQICSDCFTGERIVAHVPLVSTFSALIADHLEIGVRESKPVNLKSCLPCQNVRKRYQRVSIHLNPCLAE